MVDFTLAIDPAGTVLSVKKERRSLADASLLFNFAFAKLRPVYPENSIRDRHGTDGHRFSRSLTPGCGAFGWRICTRDMPFRKRSGL